MLQIACVYNFYKLRQVHTSNLIYGAVSRNELVLRVLLRDYVTLGDTPSHPTVHVLLGGESLCSYTFEQQVFKHP